ncbi:hypothetical protein MAM1_0880d11330 [Mucor ambiguus]|uniref:Uncharacterized protein n=1 Tax=Mucor ambiguus TaxID=91626 RepID=A0A0C9LZ92_9FUNG|nr:hypothetical protein MAM1_0880d11330 [Mucor ambiguus]
MVVRNLDIERGWSNGALAQVINMSDGVIELMPLDNGSTKLVRRKQEYVPGTYYSRRQFPIVLAYASTIHTVQSLTLPRVLICFDDMPSHGELYIAMSRIRRGDELCFFGVNAGDVEERFQSYLNCDAIEIMEKLY